MTAIAPITSHTKNEATEELKARRLPLP